MYDFVNTIYSEIRRAIPFALIGLAAGAIILVVLIRKRRRESARFPKAQAAAILLLTCWLGGLASVTFAGRMIGMHTDIQLRPLLAFREAWNAFTLRSWLNPLLNVAIFIPLGALLPLAAKRFRRWYWALMAGAAVSLVIEVLQYTLGRGQADIDDWICNTLGTMLGYCLCMLVISLTEKRWKIAAVCAVLPALSAAALAGVFLVYYFQPYGNLGEAPIYAADTRGVEWVQECELSKEPGPSGIYWAEPFTVEECDAFAVEFVGRLGAEINFSGPGVQYYDNTAVYSDHSTYSLWIDYKDRSYSYTDFRVDRELVRSGKGGAVTENELRDALGELGIDVPDAAEFTVADGERGEYVFRAESVSKDGVLTYGELSCRVLEGGILYQVDNALSESILQGDADVISSREAYDRLCAGYFSWADVQAFEYMPPTQVRVTDCTLKYLIDSKGFRQPVYVFTLSDNRYEELQGTCEWSTCVPALSGR